MGHFSKNSHIDQIHEEFELSILENQKSSMHRETFRYISSTSYFYLFSDIFNNISLIHNQSIVPLNTYLILENKGIDFNNELLISDISRENLIDNTINKPEDSLNLIVNHFPIFDLFN